MLTPMALIFSMVREEVSVPSSSSVMMENKGIPKVASRGSKYSPRVARASQNSSAWVGWGMLSVLWVLSLLPP